MGEIIQFDTSAQQIAGKNITYAIQSDNRLVFNESYTIIGEKLRASSIYACYDLVVIGDVEAEDIDVRGNLTVMGNIKSQTLSCSKNITCNGTINSEKLFGNEIIADNINCGILSCNGNVIARSVIDIQQSIETEKSVITGEGILGNGSFSARNAVAAEYFEFDGDITGKVCELETDTSFGGSQLIAGEDAIDKAKAQLFEMISTTLAAAGKVNEDSLVQATVKLSSVDDRLLSDWEKLTTKLVELSYADKITNFGDYLYIIAAKKLLPKEIIEYETLEHVFGDMLDNAEQNIDLLDFHAETIDEVAYALKVIDLCKMEMKIDTDEAYDRILQKLGVKYHTAIKYLG